MKYLLLSILYLASSSLFAQDLGIPERPTPKSIPYYTWSSEEKDMLGVLYKVEGDSIYVIPENLFFAQEERFLSYPNTISPNFLKAYSHQNASIKARKKGKVYFYVVLGAVVGAGVGIADIVQSYRTCNKDFLCNIMGRPARKYSDLQVVGMGAAAGSLLGWGVGTIKIKVPLNDRVEVRRYTVFREF